MHLSSELFQKIQTQYELYQVSEKDLFAERRRQLVLVPIAREIILEAVGTGTASNEVLTTLIQILKYKSARESVEKYMPVAVKDATKRADLLQRWYAVGEFGFTGAGLNKISALDPNQGKIVAEFLLNAAQVENEHDAIYLVQDFEWHKIPQVTSGIFSPWLYYLNPTIFPIQNNSHATFLTWARQPVKDYPANIAFFRAVARAIGEPDLGITDIFTYSFSGPLTGPTPTASMSNTQTARPLNQIFYGPPGTGKTFTTLEEAVLIANPEFQPQGNTDEAIRESFRKEYNRLRGEGQIEFITFHQSMSYEDFIEGIKPMKPTEGDTYLKYAVEDGLFKRLVKAAEYRPDVQTTTFSMPEDEFGQATFYKMSLGRAGDEEDEIIYRWCIENGYVALGYGEDLDYGGKSEAEIKSIVKAQGWGEFVGDALKRFIHWMRQGDYVLISAGNSICRAIGRVKGDYEFRADSPIRYHHFRKVEWLLKDVSIPVEEIYGKVFSMQSIYQLYRAELKKDFFVKAASQPLAASPKTKNYVLIIDEINRGNVSQIFGELITLIEADKRKGAKEALEVALPYSGDRFSIPQNLFIIGTMNTADRSVEALDAALRRRFRFREMMPDYTQLKASDGTDKTVDGISLPKLLQTINERITWLKDRDHQIGHSYLMGIESKEALLTAFRTAIVPLLQEYFFNDLGGIQAVLGPAFVQKQNPPSFPRGMHAVTGSNDAQLELVPIGDDFDIVAALKASLNLSAEDAA